MPEVMLSELGVQVHNDRTAMIGFTRCNHVNGNTKPPVPQSRTVANPIPGSARKFPQHNLNDTGRHREPNRRRRDLARMEAIIRCIKRVFARRNGNPTRPNAYVLGHGGGGVVGRAQVQRHGLGRRRRPEPDAGPSLQRASPERARRRRRRGPGDHLELHRAAGTARRAPGIRDALRQGLPGWGRVGEEMRGRFIRWRVEARAVDRGEESG